MTTATTYDPSGPALVAPQDGSPELAQLREIARRDQLQAIVTTGPETLTFLTGTTLITQKLLPHRVAAVVVTPDSVTAVVCVTEQQQLVAEARFPLTVEAYTEYVDDPIEAIVAVLNRVGGGERGRVGWEHDGLLPSLAEQLSRSARHVLVSVDDQLLAARMVKQPGARTALARGAAATTTALTTALAGIAPGLTNRELSVRVVSELQRAGADVTAHLVCGTGSTAGQAHPQPHDEPLGVGDTIRIDAGGYFSGQFSDIARSAVVAASTPDQRAAYRLVYEVQAALADRARPGTPVNQLFAEAGDRYRRAGFPFRLAHVGHGLGLSLHEPPVLNPFDETRLEPGMVINIEPAVWTEAGAILQLEDTYLITEHGAEPLSAPVADGRLPTLLG